MANFCVLNSHRQKATSCLFGLFKRRTETRAGACSCHVARLAGSSGWLASVWRVVCTMCVHVCTTRAARGTCVGCSFDYGQKTRTHVRGILRSQMAENFTTTQEKLSRTFLQISLKSFARPFTCNCLPFTDECKFLSVQTTK